MRPIRLVPHTHWDREWYLPFEAFRDRLVRTMDLVLDLLRGDDQWTHFHLDGQTAVVDDYLSVRPEWEAEIRAHVSSGRLSCGPWVTLVDEFLVSGESIIRNLEDGMARADELGGALRVGYLPDQFGHIGQMPQILSGAGITRAVVWRGVPSSVDASDFVWRAPDGSAVEAFYLPFGYGQGKEMPGERDALIARLTREEKRLAPRLAPSEAALIMVGDDHAAPESRLVDAVAELQVEGIDASIVSLQDHLADRRAPAHELTGELRSAARANLLPNTYSVRVHQKTERARAEHLLERYAEPLAALVAGEEWPHRELAAAWRLLHLNGAHDSVCGCSTDQVAAAVDERTQRATAIARSVAERALGRLAAEAGPAGTLAFNPSPFERDGVPGVGWGVVDARPGPERVDVLDLGLRLEDQGDAGDLYTFSPDGEVHHGASSERFDAHITAWRAPDEPFVRVEVDIDNRAPDHRLRLLLHLPEPADVSRAGSPFEIVTRPRVGEGGSSEPPPTAWPARGFVLAGGRGFLSEGVFEYELLEEGALAVTLLRCVGTISKRSLPTRTVMAGPDVPTPAAQMIGRHKIAFGILLSDPGEGIVDVWERYALPLMTVSAPGGGSLGRDGVLLDVDVPALSSVRRPEGRVRVRVWNPWDRALPARVADVSIDLRPHGIETIALD
ncbi:MAG: hypothetical protein ACRDJI_00670 [Actinomycetota bacterium]